MPAFDEVRLEVGNNFTKLRFGSEGGLEFPDKVVRFRGGYTVNTMVTQPQGGWTIIPGIKNATDFASWRSFIMARQIRRRGFRYKDNTDFSVTGQALRIQSDATSEFLQLEVGYSSGAVTFLRTITKPVTGTVTVYQDSTDITSLVSIDTTTGIIRPVGSPQDFGTGSPSPVMTADFEFDVPVFFDIKRIPTIQQTHGYDNIGPMKIEVLPIEDQTA